MKEEILEVHEDIEVTLGEVEVSEVTDEISAVTVESIAEETVNTTPDISEAILLASNVVDSPNICSLEVITMFDDQNDLLRKICAIQPGSSLLYVVTIQNAIVKSDLSLSTLCAEGPKGLLSWISWQDFIEKVKPVLSADELPHLVVRNSSIGGPSESESKFDPFSEVLIEMLPIGYRLVNLKPSTWNNNTFIKTVSLGNVELENSKDAEQHIEGELSYSFPIETNITFLSSYPINGLPVEMADDERKNFIVGSGTTYLVNNTFAVERLVPALKKEIVSLNGTFGLHEYDIEGKIISIFGLNADGSTIEESHLISARVVSSETFDIKDTYHLEDCTATTTKENIPSTTEELPIAIPRVDGPVYPGFKKFFYVALVLVFGTFFIALIDVVRKLRKERKAKAQGRRTYQKVDPTF